MLIKTIMTPHYQLIGIVKMKKETLYQVLRMKTGTFSDSLVRHRAASETAS